MLFCLVLTLLPLGLLGIWQSQRIYEESEHRAQLSLLAQVQCASASTRRALESGETVGSISNELKDAPEECTTALSMVILNRRGEVLSTSPNEETVRKSLPADTAVSEIALKQPNTFSANDQSGKMRDFAVIPLGPEDVYLIGSRERAQNLLARLAYLSLPLIMWGASLLVTWLALNRLIVSPVTGLDADLSEFTATRKPPETQLSPDSPIELRRLQNSFEEMARNILEKENEKTERRAEKAALLKELHHRVKNNLQVISSLLNLQIRDAGESNSSRAVQQVQRRVMALSNVHRTLFHAGDHTLIDARALIEQITRAGFEHTASSVQITLDIENVVLPHNQAIPLSLLIAETMTENLNTSATRQTSAPKLSIAMWRDRKKDACLSIQKSNSSENNGGTPEVLSDLSLKMVEAFVRQLDGQFSITEDDTGYRIDVSFALLVADIIPSDCEKVTLWRGSA